jgi:hypothetical protein
LKTYLIVALVALSVTATRPSRALEKAQHTVSWYGAHTSQREAVLRACENDHTYDEDADCRNANSAAHDAVAQTLGADADKSDPEANPTYYEHDGPLIAMTLSMCGRKQAPVAWCQAARTAQATGVH